MPHRDSLTMRVPKTGSAATGESGELASFAMRFDETRDASGLDAGLRHVPKAPQGRDYAIDDYTVEKQDHDKQRPAEYDKADRLSAYLHRPAAGRP